MCVKSFYRVSHSISQKLLFSIFCLSITEYGYFLLICLPIRWFSSVYIMWLLNLNPLQYTCLENPMDGGAWWAAVHVVSLGVDTTEQLHFHFSLSCIGEGNGNPFQCSCMENPRDGGAWAAVSGVSQSRTWLKRLSSRSSIFSFSYCFSVWEYLFYSQCSFYVWKLSILSYNFMTKLITIAFIFVTFIIWFLF